MNNTLKVHNIKLFWHIQKQKSKRQHLKNRKYFYVGPFVYNELDEMDELKKIDSMTKDEYFFYRKQLSKNKRSFLKPITKFKNNDIDNDINYIDLISIDGEALHKYDEVELLEIDAMTRTEYMEYRNNKNKKGGTR